MKIESKTTGERLIRISLVLVMCAAFSAWFAYDGLWGWPSKNLAWAVKYLPEKPGDPRLNWRATVDNLKRAVETADKQKPMTRTELDALLGQPALVQMKTFIYFGPDMTARIRVADGKVVDVATGPIDPADSSETPVYTLPDRIKRIEPGSPEAHVERDLGKPRRVQPEVLWYIGPGAYAQVEIADGSVTGKPKMVEATDHSESDIYMQKVLAVGLAILSLYIAIKVFQAITLRVVLDDTGLTFNRKHIPWEAMTDLKTDEYMAKGWVDLVYHASAEPRQLRLDSYHIDRFKEIVLTICERKGFPPPPFSQSSDFPTETAERSVHHGGTETERQDDAGDGE